MKANFEINAARESGDQNPRRTWEWIAETKSLKKAKEKAVKLSKKYHEIEIIGTEEGEIIHHSYWQNGKLEIDMAV